MSQKNAENRKREAGIHLTITYFVAAAIARALYEDMPEVNQKNSPMLASGYEKG